jgi:hypothetical protein
MLEKKTLKKPVDLITINTSIRTKILILRFREFYI